MGSIENLSGLCKTTKNNNLIDTDCMVITRGKEGLQKLEEGKRDISGDGRRLDWG